MFGLRPSTYFVILLPGMALIDFVFTLLYAALSGNWAATGSAAVLSVLMLGGINLMMGRLLIDPVRRAEQGVEVPISRLSRRLRTLPFLTSAWVFCLTILYALANFSLGTFILPQSETSDVPAGLLMVTVGWFSFVYACQFSLYAYFVGMDASAYARKWLLAEKGTAVRASYTPLAVRVVLGMVVITFLPASIIVLDALYFVDVRALQGLSLEKAILLDVAATIVTACISIFFISRSFTRPLDQLRTAMEEISRGRYLARAAEMTDDELGHLARRFNRMARELEEKEAIRVTLHKFVNQDVASLLISADKDDPRLSGELRLATVLFTDIEGFTRLSETISPVQLIDVLNEYFDTVSKIIRKYDGLVLNYNGDSVYAVFNVPTDDPDHAANALHCALEIQSTLASLNFSGGITLPTRIGLNSGPVVAGLVGTDHRLEYSVYGDVVNVASRLEHMNKELGTSVLASASTARLAWGLNGTSLAFKPRGEKAVRGKMNSIEVFEVVTLEDGAHQTPAADSKMG